MGSPVYVTFKVDVFYQTFLRAYFEQYDLLFEFPAKSEFNILLEFLVKKQPRAQRSPDPEIDFMNQLEIHKKTQYGDQAFNVQLQYMEHKNVLSYNFIPPAGERIFNDKIKDLFKLVFHKHVDQAIHRIGLRKKDAIYSFMDEFNMSVSRSERLNKNYQRYEEKLTREYDRWNAAKRQAKHRKKNKKTLSVKRQKSSERHGL